MRKFQGSCFVFIIITLITLILVPLSSSTYHSERRKACAVLCGRSNSRNSWPSAPSSELRGRWSWPWEWFSPPPPTTTPSPHAPTPDPYDVCCDYWRSWFPNSAEYNICRGYLVHCD